MEEVSVEMQRYQGMYGKCRLEYCSSGSTLHRTRIRGGTEMATDTSQGKIGTSFLKDPILIAQLTRLTTDSSIGLDDTRIYQG